MTVSDLCDLFLAWNALNRKPRTVQFYEGQLAKVLPLVGHLEADQVRPRHLLTLRSTWHLIQALQRLFNWAAENDLAAAGPISAMKRPRLGRRKRVLGRADLLRLLRKASDDFRRLLLAARETAAGGGSIMFWLRRSRATAMR